MNSAWKEQRLGAVLQLHYGKPLDEKDRSPNGLYPVYGANGEKGRSNKFYFDRPSIIVGRKGSAGEINFTEEKFWPLDVTYFTTFDDTQHDLRFLYYLLTILNLPALAKGVKPGINREEVYSQAVRMPSLPEQRRIVDILDKAFAAVASAKANAEKNRQNANTLFEGYLTSVFTCAGSNWQTWRFGDERLLEIVDGDRGENYPKADDFHTQGDCLFLNTKNVRPDGFDFASTMFITAAKDRQMRKGKLKRGDVVLTTRGTIGNIGLYSGHVPYGDIRINSGMLILRPNGRALLSSFLFELLRSEMVKSQIKQYTTGAAQPQLPIKTLENFTIRVPENLADQHRLVSQLRAFEPETQRLGVLYERKLAALLALRESLLHGAFAGAL